MVRIRLARVGKRGHATFRIVVTEHTRPSKSGALADVGSYDPHADAVRVDEERLRLYLAHGAQLSPTVQNLLVGKGLLDRPKVPLRKARKQTPENAPQAESGSQHTAETPAALTSTGAPKDTPADAEKSA